MPVEPKYPTREEVEKAESWTELALMMGLSPRYYYKVKPVQQYVRDTYPDTKLGRTKSKLPDEELARLVSISTSYRGLLKACGLTPAGGSYQAVQKRVRELGLDTSHFLGQAHGRGKTYVSKSGRPLLEYLTENGPYIGADRLKQRLLREGLKEHRCEACGNAEWQERPIPIQLDHINGDHLDNRLENLRIVCPNCHAQTETYCGRKLKKDFGFCVCGSPRHRRQSKTCGKRECSTSAMISSRKKSNGGKQRELTSTCPICSGPKDPRFKTCSYECAHRKTRKVDWDSVDLIVELQTKSKLQLAKELGCSDNAINKRLKKMVVAPPGIEPGHPEG